ncbi:MAG: TVP38/TMEM64 family protein [bacterium]
MMTNDNDELVTATRPIAKNKWRKILPLLVVAVLAIAFFASGAQNYLNFEALEKNQEALQTWVARSFLIAILIYTAIYALSAAIPFFPGSSLLTIVGGFLFGQWAGTAAVVLGATIGSSLLFLAAKGIFGEALSNKAGGFVGKMEQGFREDELSYMFVLRLVPLFPFFAVNIAAGLLDVKFRNYFIGTLFGIIPGSFVFVSIGNAIGATFSAGDLSLQGILLQPPVLMSIIGLTILSLIPVIYKRFFKKQSAGA